MIRFAITFVLAAAIPLGNAVAADDVQQPAATEFKVRPIGHSRKAGAHSASSCHGNSRMAVSHPNARYFGKQPILFNVPHANATMFPPPIAREIHAKRDFHNPRPFFLSGGIKIVYDLLLYRSFVTHKPPEEAAK